MQVICRSAINLTALQRHNVDAVSHIGGMTLCMQNIS